ncbi:SDR family NAD(P)-dependent oxidoreductase [Amycolatopsis methanolica]|uniref:2,3-dihydroxy-2,3-dihydro-p-cumate dehydrogenase n=1 Tax=Amycolatopsis methanolica 239 TaxID=1068978 RepID=A0A076MQP9_AMYME|nr:SDR family oxidoreductase [Amycolatopsis methanolica]AIJ21276.1 2,3-dihydroxy-2,3-dihydro-p-cumate dehydrogenase [Amycolatopsis methanolica 239]
MRFGEGRAAVVTGACSDVGRAVADRLAEAGVALALGDLDAESLEKTAAELTRPGVLSPVTCAGDLSTQDCANRLAGACVERFGRVDILVNNAGGGVIMPTLAHSEETLRTTLDRNLWTTLHCTLAVLPTMKERQYGRIVSLGAESVRNGLDWHAVYNAAKGGVHGFTTGLAREFARDGITVNVVAPSIIRTRAMLSYDKPEELESIAKIQAEIPLGRAGSVHEVASMVEYLASDDASYVTGQVVSVNGGSSML